MSLHFINNYRDSDFTTSLGSTFQHLKKTSVSQSDKRSKDNIRNISAMCPEETTTVRIIEISGTHMEDLGPPDGLFMYLFIEVCKGAILVFFPSLHDYLKEKWN